MSQIGKRRNIAGWSFLVATAGVLLATAGSALALEVDVDGCKDHPLFNRMPNHFIEACLDVDFDAQDFPLGSLNEDHQPKDVMTVEGKKMVIDYQLQQDGSKVNSGLQTMRNYQNAVKAAGGVVVAEFGAASSDKGLCDPVFGCVDRATTLKVTQGNREIWVLVMPVDMNDGRYRLQISERETMAQDIGANDLLDAIRKTGFVALQVNFDTGKATIKPDSLAQMDQVAQMLKSAPDLKLQVAGHTDNVGGAAANQKLSDARAQSVAKALAERGIAAERLTAKGYGQSKPVADNATDEGRAKNRRVELVKT